MKPVFSWSIRTQLLFLSVLILLPALGLILYTDYEQERHETEEAGERVVTTSRLLGTLQERQTDAARQLLVTLARLPALQKHDAPACNQLFAELLRLNPQYANIFAVDADGMLFASGTPSEPISLTDRKYFQEAVRTRAFSAGEYAMGRITRKPSLHFSYPVLDAQGKLLGVVAAALNADYYGPLFAETHLPAGSVLAVTDHQGTLLFGSVPALQKLVGRPDQATHIQKMSGILAAGTYLTTDADGVERLYAFQQLRLGKDQPAYLRLRVGLPTRVVLAEAQHIFHRNLVLLVFASLAAMGLAWLVGDRLIVRRVRSLVESAHRLEKDQPKLRLGFEHSQDELGRLEAAFDRMEGSLAARAGQQRQIQENLLDERNLFIGGPMMFFRSRVSESGWLVIEYASPNVQQHSGYTSEDLTTGRITFQEILHPDDAPRIVQETKNFMKTEKPFYEREYRLRRADGQYRWMHDYSVVTSREEGEVVMQGYILDVQADKETEEKLRRSSRALRAISDCNQAIIRATDEICMINEVCRCIVDVGEYRMAWVGYAQNDAEKTVRPMAHAGCEAGYLDQIRVSWAESPHGMGPGGISIRTGQPCVFNDIQNDPRFTPWREAAVQRGYASVAGLPLLASGRPIGALLIYSAQSNAFDVQEIELLRELADDLGYGIGVLRAKSRQKQMEQALRTERNLFMAGPIMVFRWRNEENWPVDYVSANVREQLGYPPEELTSGRIQYADIVHPDDVARCLQEIESHLRAGSKYFEQQYRLRRADGAYRWMSDFSMVVRDSSGAANQLYGYVYDVTEHKMTEAALEQRVLALTAPQEDVTQLRFEDLFNVEEIQKIQDGFSAATGVASIITHPDGTPITRPSNFCRLCQIIRKTPQGLTNCMYSDAQIGRPNPDGPTVQPCLSGGLWDAGASICVGDRPVANWMIGQVLDDVKSDEGMMEYAREIGADANEFQSALKEVTRMPKEQFRRISEALFLIARQLSRLALQNVQQAREITRREKAEEAVRQSEARERAKAAELEAFMNAEPAAVWIAHDPECRRITSNRAAARLLRAKKSEQVHVEASASASLPCKILRKGLEVPPEELPLRQAIRDGVEVRHMELDLLCEDGTVRTVLGQATPLFDAAGKVYGAVSVFVDITERKRAEERLRRLADCFLSFDPEPTENINRLTALCGEVLGADCTMYNRMENKRLYARSQWHSPPDFAPHGVEKGTICHELLRNNGDRVMIVHHLSDTEYARNNPALLRSGFDCYLGKAVQLGHQPCGVLCAFFRHDISIDESDQQVIGLLATAVGIEERRREAQESLRLAETRYRSLVENVPAITYHAEVDDPVGTLFVSPQIETILGYSPREYLAERHSWEVHLHPEDRSRVVAAVQAAVAQGGGYRDEYRMMAKDGHVVWIHDEGLIQKDPTTGRRVLQGLMLDVTEQKRAEEHGRIASGLRAVVDVADELMACSSVDEIYRQAVELARKKLNIERCAIFVSEGDAFHGTWGTNLEGETTDEHQLMFEKSSHSFWRPDFLHHPLETLRWDQAQIMRHVCKDNARIQVGEGWVARTPIAQSGNVPQAMILNDTAISGKECDPIQQDLLALLATFLAHLIEMKRTEEALRNNEEKFRAMTTSAHEAIVMIGDDGNITFWNEAAETMFGYSREEAEGQPAQRLLASPHQLKKYDRAFPHWQKAGRRTAVGETMELNISRKDGSRLPVELSLTSFLIKDRWNAMAIIRDVSGRKRMEAMVQAKEEAEAANRAKSSFLANMSHEIRTPMNGILGMVELLLGTPLNKEQREYVQIIYRSGEALLTILNDVLDLSKIEAGRMELEHIPFELSTVVADVVEMYRPHLEGTSVQLKLKIDPELPTQLVGDPARLRQVLGNLVNNAVKFTHQGRIQVKAKVLEHAAGRVRFTISVEDTGIGIPSDKLEQLFMPFTQADSSTTRHFGGTGLGLANAKRLAELMGGTIRVDSTQGVGTTFTLEIELEVAESDLLGKSCVLLPSEHSHSMDLLAASKIPAKVLLVEDHPLNQNLAARMLYRLGATVTAVGNGREALEKLQEGPFDLVFMDCQMLEMDGFEATAVIRAQETRTAGHLPIIAMTAHAMKGDRERCLASGMDDYVSKPLKLAALRQMLVKWFEVGLSSNERIKPILIKQETPKPEPAQIKPRASSLDAEHLAQIRSLFASQAEFATMVLHPFLDDLAKQLVELSRLAGEQRWSDLEKAAHKLKGSASNVGAMNLSHRAGKLENLAREPDRSGIEEFFPRLHREAERVRKEIEKML